MDIKRSENDSTRGNITKNWIWYYYIPPTH
jgi:hypothetical protein